MANVNTMNFNQLATVLNAITAQATGKAAITPTNTAEFVSVAQTTLRTGYDPVMAAISQVLGRTIFSVRPYTRKFKSLYVTEQQFGNRTRKLQAVDKDFEEDDRIKLVDGQSIDQQRVNKPAVLETSFYGQNVYQKSLTIFRDQLDTAFSSADEFGRFVSMIMQNASDMIEQAHETTARATVANFIGAKNALQGSDTKTHVIYLVDAYNAETGGSFTRDQILSAENFGRFAKWLYGFLKTLSGMMTERSYMYHMDITDKEVARHTPIRDQRMYLFTPYVNRVGANVLADVYHDNLLKYAEHEEVNFWQAITAPAQVQVTPSYISADGTLATPEAQTIPYVLGVIFDREAMGITTVNRWSANAPFNARGGYTNMFWHFTDRYWNDLTENGTVLIMDSAAGSEGSSIVGTAVVGTAIVGADDTEG